jgi:hypothetical protein
MYAPKQSGAIFVNATNNATTACPESFANVEFNAADADARELIIELRGTTEK